jgi:hypothetical protein
LESLISHITCGCSQVWCVLHPPQLQIQWNLCPSLLKGL